MGGVLLDSRSNGVGKNPALTVGDVKTANFSSSTRRSGDSLRDDNPGTNLRRPPPGSPSQLAQKNFDIQIPSPPTLQSRRHNDFVDFWNSAATNYYNNDVAVTRSSSFEKTVQKQRPSPVTPKRTTHHETPGLTVVISPPKPFVYNSGTPTATGRQQQHQPPNRRSRSFSPAGQALVAASSAAAAFPPRRRPTPDRLQTTGQQRDKTLPTPDRQPLLPATAAAAGSGTPDPPGHSAARALAHQKVRSAASHGKSNNKKQQTPNNNNKQKQQRFTDKLGPPALPTGEVRKKKQSPQELARGQNNREGQKTSKSTKPTKPDGYPSDEEKKKVLAFLPSSNDPGECPSDEEGGKKGKHKQKKERKPHNQAQELSLPPDQDAPQPGVDPVICPRERSMSSAGSAALPPAPLSQASNHEDDWVDDDPNAPPADTMATKPSRIALTFSGMEQSTPSPSKARLALSFSGPTTTTVTSDEVTPTQIPPKDKATKTKNSNAALDNDVVLSRKAKHAVEEEKRQRKVKKASSASIAPTQPHDNEEKGFFCAPSPFGGLAFVLPTCGSGETTAEDDSDEEEADSEFDSVLGEDFDEDDCSVTSVRGGGGGCTLPVKTQQRRLVSLLSLAAKRHSGGYFLWPSCANADCCSVGSGSCGTQNTKTTAARERRRRRRGRSRGRRSRRERRRRKQQRAAQEPPQQQGCDLIPTMWTVGEDGSIM